ncbi:hypothetical protein V9T40_014814 [Parthenolecanium corni]|uniref:Uncharacterized protein n=1 Tax=Parthenolecanium corni TaxID=536013 RepID=A0AAN9T2S3_9HEMI
MMTMTFQEINDDSVHDKNRNMQPATILFMDDSVCQGESGGDDDSDDTGSDKSLDNIAWIASALSLPYRTTLSTSLKYQKILCRMSCAEQENRTSVDCARREHNILRYFSHVDRPKFRTLAIHARLSKDKSGPFDVDNSAGDRDDDDCNEEFMGETCNEI